LSKKRRVDDEQHINELEDQVIALKAYISSLEGDAPSQVLPFIANHDKQDVSVGSDEDETVQEHLDEGVNEEGMLPAAVDEISNLMWSLDVSDAGESSFQGPSGNFCFPDRGTKHDGLGSKHPDTHESRIPSSALLEDDDQRTQLINLFFDNVNPYHCFVEPEDSSDPARMAEPDPSPPFALLRAAVVAAGSLYASDPYSTLVGRTYIAYAENMALRCCREHPSLATLRALTIFSWTELGTGNNHMGWMYNSMAGSMVLELGLHAEGLVTSKTMTWKTRASRRKAFWAFLVQDRMATSLLGRNCAVPWRRVRVPDLSTVFDGSNLTNEQEAFIHQCRLWSIHDQHMDQIYAFEFDDLPRSQKDRLLLRAREDLLTFRSTLVHGVSIDPGTSSKSVCILHMSYHMSIMLVHRPFIRAGTGLEIGRLAFRAIATAASAFTRVLGALRKTHSLVCMPFILIHHVLTATISHLFNATSANVRLRRVSVKGAKVCIQAMEELSQTWPDRGKQAIRLAQELAARWMVVSALPIHLSYPLVRDEHEYCPTPIESGTSHRVNPAEAIDLDLRFMDVRSFEDVFDVDPSILASLEDADDIFPVGT
jgi:hypothetical protein